VVGDEQHRFVQLQIAAIDLEAIEVVLHGGQHGVRQWVGVPGCAGVSDEKSC
jgi:hypothetical protein